MKRCPHCFNQYDDFEERCKLCGELLEDAMEKPEKGKKKKNGFRMILVILLLCSLTANAFLVLLLKSKDDEAQYWRVEYNWQNRDYLKIEPQYRFFDSYARIVPNDGSNLYHKYGCKELDSSEKFWIYNEAAAKEKASPCPTCCGSANDISAKPTEDKPAKQTEPSKEFSGYGMQARLNGEEMFFEQGGCSGTSSVWNTMYYVNGSDIRSFTIIYEADLMGSWDTFSKSAGTENDLTKDRLYFYYNSDVLGRSTFGTVKMSEWTVTITEVTESSISGTISGAFGSHTESKSNPYTIEGSFCMARSKSQIEGTTACLVHTNLWGGGGSFGSSGSSGSGGGSSSGSSATSNRCGVCSGSGACHICNGTGYVYNDHLNVSAWKKCSICNGKKTCNACGGKGYH